MEDPKVVETIRGRDIPDDVKEKAVEEARYIARTDTACFFDAHEIDEFADWRATPSGHDFWNRIYEVKEI